MKYMGSKRRLAKKLLPTLLVERGLRPWVEPFVGGANLIDKVWGVRHGNDNHYYLIEYLKAMQGGWLPPANVSEKEYKSIKNYPDAYPARLVGAVGFGCSFGGGWMGTYARDDRGDNYAAQLRKNAKKQAPFLSGITFTYGDYREMHIPPNSFIYCDPPYKGATKYKTGKFNHDEFWQWCRDKVAKGHKVFISEYNAPPDFETVLTIKHDVNINNNTSSQQVRIEKLFAYSKT